MWGGHPLFCPESFGDLTIDVVFQALDYGQNFKRQDAHLLELGTATLTSCFVNANRDPKKGSPAKPSDFFYFSNSNPINSAIADSFFSLIKDKLMPSWVVYASPIDVLKQSKGVSHPKKNRCLVGDGVAIFCPVIEDDEIYSDFVVFNECGTGWRSVTDTDSGKQYEVFAIPDYEQQYCRDLTLKRR